MNDNINKRVKALELGSGLLMDRIGHLEQRVRILQRLEERIRKLEENDPTLTTDHLPAIERRREVRICYACGREK